MDMIPHQFASSLLNLRKTNDTAYAFQSGSLIYDSRNNFVVNAIEKGYDRILWLDSDMKFEPDTLERLNKHLDDGCEFVAGLFFKRRIPTTPVIYKRLDYITDGTVRASVESMTDYPQDQLFRIAGCGFGVVMTTVDLCRRVWDRFGPPFNPLPNMGEDFSFCWRVTQLGVPMWCDSSVKCGHIGIYEYGEHTWLEQQALKQIDPAEIEHAATT